jgi:alpha-D-xyloside xylohydrolase
MWKITRVEPSCAVFSENADTLRVEAARGECFRITQTRGKDFLLQNEPVVVRPEAEATARVTETETDYEVSASRMTVKLSKATGTLSFWNAEGARLTGEREGDGRALRETDIVNYRYADNAVRTQSRGVDGARVTAEGTPYVGRRGFSYRLAFLFNEDEAIYGLGQHEERVLDHRRGRQYLYQHNLKISCPALVSSAGWGTLLNTGSFAVYEGCASYGCFTVNAADELDYFLFNGGGLDGCVATIRSLTGDAPLPPKWAFGYLQSKERYSTQQELLDVAAEYRRRGIPLDAVVQDWCSWPEGLWGQKSADPARYPDLKACTDALHTINCRLMWSIWPNMTGDGPDRQAFRQRNLLLGNLSTYNAFSGQARALYWKQMNDGLYQNGVDAWWCDCTEPFEADWKGEREETPEERMRLNVSEFERYIDPARVNVYSLYHSQGIYEGQREADESKRVLVLTRSGFPGQQRYGTFVWNGDTSATWRQLADWIPNALNLCVTGIPYWTQDVGAFFVKKWAQWFGRGEYERGAEDEAYRELYLRWFQASAFLPMLRAHGTDTPREVWRFGAPGETYYDGLVQMIELRMRLVPYLYSLAADITFRRGTMLRMLAFDFPSDRTALEITDEYLLGRALLVCPVLEEGARSRKVYLPAGADWYDFHTGAFLRGGQWMEADAPLTTVPLFVRAGSILPLGPVKQFVSQENDQPLVLRVYPGADGDFTLYDDAGDGYGYERGEFGLLRLHWDDRERSLTQRAEGEARFIPTDRTVEIVAR